MISVTTRATKSVVGCMSLTLPLPGPEVKAVVQTVKLPGEPLESSEIHLWEGRQRGGSSVLSLGVLGVLSLYHVLVHRCTSRLPICQPRHIRLTNAVYRRQILLRYRSFLEGVEQPPYIFVRQPPGFPEFFSLAHNFILQLVISGGAVCHN
jgi:hypothetical protein